MKIKFQKKFFIKKRLKKKLPSTKKQKLLILFLILIFFLIEVKFIIKKKIRNIIHIGINLDNKYIYPCLVFLTSLLENRATSTFYSIHILTSGDIVKKNLDKINILLNKYGNFNSNVTYYDMGNDFSGAITNKYISTTAYYRIAFPSKLPNVDKIIYSDVDVINFQDLSEMYNIELKNNIYFAGTLDYSYEIDDITRLGIPAKKYMNSGILIMNLKSMRENGVEQKIREFIYSHYLNHHDQTAINGACYNNLQILPYKYGVYALNSFNDLMDFNNKQDEKYRYNEDELKKAFYEPVLLHFPGYVKPFDHNCLMNKRVYWWYFAKNSGFYQEILDYYQFNKDSIEKILKEIPSDGGLLKRNYKKI